MSKNYQPKERYVLKHSDERKPFVVNKIIKSLKRAGADDRLAREIAEEIEKDRAIKTTEDIHKKVFSSIRHRSRPVAARYNLKRAIADLGPTGFPFEKFVGRLLESFGYSVQVGVDVKGACISHEIDVVAEKTDEHFMVECKFHNKYWLRSHIQTVLYVKARFDDVEKAWKRKKGHSDKFHQAWIVTNTKFTNQAIKYAKCSGIKLVGWNYPKKDSLARMIDVSGLHPVTAITQLSKKEKLALVENGLVLCRDVIGGYRTMFKLGISKDKIAKIQKEAYNISNL